LPSLSLSLERLHRAIDAAVAPLAATHSARLQCRLGCTGCCVDDLTIFEVEAEGIRRHCARLLAEEAPHPVGACAFLGAAGECRIYAHRPYVCRTQGLPLRWLDEAPDDHVVELRDICPLNDVGEPIEDLPAEQCWTLGPIEARLAALQREQDGGEERRVRLRDLFGAGAG
jgi:uncharacterized protein